VNSITANARINEDSGLYEYLGVGTQRSQMQEGGFFLQDSWRPTAKLTVEGGVRYVYWPPWYSTTNNIASFSEAAYDPSKAPTVNPANGQLSGGVRYNGVILPGDGFEGEGQDAVVASDPAVLALFGGHPRGLSETHGNVFEPRLGASYQLTEGDAPVVRERLRASYADRAVVPCRVVMWLASIRL
jgi:outer membrane receptor protein involved in Fe transport